MGSSAFVLGFFVALGGWTATKLTKQIDDMFDPPKIEKQVESEKVTPAIKEKEDDRGN